MYDYIYRRLSSSNLEDRPGAIVQAARHAHTDAMRSVTTSHNNSKACTWIAHEHMHHYIAVKVLHMLLTVLQQLHNVCLDST